MKKFILIFSFLILFCNNVYAVDTDESLQTEFDIIDIDEFNNQLKSFDNEYTQNFDLKEYITKTVKGELDFDLRDIINNLVKSLFKELYNHLDIMRNIIFIACICALAKNLSSSFESKAVGELSFYACYIVMIILLIQSFKLAVDLVSGTISDVSNLLTIFLPVLTALLISAGNYMTLSAFHPIVILVSEIMINIIKNFALPIIFCTAMLDIINFISSKPLLDNMTELIKKCISWSLKGICILFTATLALNKLTAPMIEGVLNKTAKVAVGAIPVVGEIMVGTVDTVANFTSLMKNGTAIAVIIFMLLLCTFPVLKLVSLILIYKITAAIIQPISDSRIIKCIENISTSCQLLLGALVCVMIMFAFVAMIAISITI